MFFVTVFCHNYSVAQLERKHGYNLRHRVLCHFHQSVQTTPTCGVSRGSHAYLRHSKSKNEYGQSSIDVDYLESLSLICPRGQFNELPGQNAAHACFLTNPNYFFDTKRSKSYSASMGKNCPVGHYIGSFNSGDASPTGDTLKTKINTNSLPMKINFQFF